MLHKSKFGHHGEKLPSDLDGQIPEEGDDWRDMNFDHGPLSPDEPGISNEERTQRMEHLDKEWWPKIIAIANSQRAQIELSPADTPIKHWEDVMHQHPPRQHGFEVEEINED
jgi:hypothetical protein